VLTLENKPLRYDGNDSPRAGKIQPVRPAVGFRGRQKALRRLAETQREKTPGVMMTIAKTRNLSCPDMVVPTNKRSSIKRALGLAFLSLVPRKSPLGLNCRPRPGSRPSLWYESAAVAAMLDRYCGRQASTLVACFKASADVQSTPVCWKCRRLGGKRVSPANGDGIFCPSVKWIIERLTF
jgi:hypothetical protein